jgi:hypothetical protein
VDFLNFLKKDSSFAAECLHLEEEDNSFAVEYLGVFVVLQLLKLAGSNDVLNFGDGGHGAECGDM